MPAWPVMAADSPPPALARTRFGGSVQGALQDQPSRRLYHTAGEGAQGQTRQGCPGVPSIGKRIIEINRKLLFKKTKSTDTLTPYLEGKYGIFYTNQNPNFPLPLAPKNQIPINISKRLIASQRFQLLRRTNLTLETSR
jgi:hypothetical protein